MRKLLKLLWICLLGILVGIFASACFFHRVDIKEKMLSLKIRAQFAFEEALHEESTPETPEQVATTTVPLSPVLQTVATSSRAIKIPVLVYHSIRPHYQGESLYQDAYDITPDLLQEEITYLKTHGYTTVHFADVDAFFEEGTSLPPKPVILSFDDGWENQYKYAYPVLKKNSVVGTFFIYTNPIGRNTHWMTWSQIVEMNKAGMEIGGHSRTHPVLTKITTSAELQKEISGSKLILEGHLGHHVTAFAYPFGMFDERVKTAVTAAGYTIARTVHSGVWSSPEQRFEFFGTLSTDHLADFVALLNK